MYFCYWVCLYLVIIFLYNFQEKLDLLSRIPEPAIEKAARTLLDLRESWEWATKEERKELAP